MVIATKQVAAGLLVAGVATVWVPQFLGIDPLSGLKKSSSSSVPGAVPRSSVGSSAGPVAGPIAGLAGWLFRSIDGFMARRQMVGLRERAERYGARVEDGENPETGARDQYQLYQVIYASGDEAGAPGRTDAAEWRRAAMADGVVGSDPA